MTPSRNVRVPDRQWRDGLRKAADEGTTLSAKINAWIEADLAGTLTITGPPPNGDGPVVTRSQLPRGQ